MAEQNRKQTGRSGPRGSDAPSDPYGLGLNIGMLDWTQLEPLGDAEAMAAAGQDLDFLPDLPNELLDEGTEDEALSEHSSESEGNRVHHMRGGRKEPPDGRAPVVTTGGNAESSPTAQGPSAVTTGQVPPGRTRASARAKSSGPAAAQRGRRNVGSSASASSGSGTQPAGISNDPSAEPSASGGDSGKKRKKPAPNLDNIDDPAERRKQRRLAKNRATAAVSRERKRVQMIQLAARTRALEQENANLQFMLGLRDQEIGKLRGNLASLPRGARDGEPRTQAAAASPSEPAVLTGTGQPPGPPPVEAPVPAPQPTSMAAPAARMPSLSASGPAGQPRPLSAGQSGQPSDDRIAPERGNESLPGMELEYAVSFQGSSDPKVMQRAQLQLPGRQGSGLLIDGLPIEVDERGMSTNIPGIIVGADGQWLRLKQRSASSFSQPPQPLQQQPPPQR